ncbi:hypothetical protein COO91_04674 [Nostoc flagelliforme CCNUN1]|uniref:Uncharacterized protein n=1 Tax=Nostoc flagelliforme CCNUN1 TaxID=2038116 RepID=A0A2K8STB4_9NOSO|nr:hypothetical protein COO91_04674 [Nostoc flagelliforme CCNUN1]
MCLSNNLYKRLAEELGVDAINRVCTGVRSFPSEFQNL